jgi:DNA-binding GntR family transcriptional regulator
MSNEEDFVSTATQNLFGRLRHEILTGRLPYGTRLRQAEVAARFGISTTPVREAFRELAALGLVAIHPNRGAIVHRPTARELGHIYEARILLEPISVAWSAPRISPEVIEEARKLIQKMKEVETSDVGVDMNRRFHSLISAASGNDLLHRLTINLLDLSTPYLVWFREQSKAEFERQAAEHEEILLACERRDPQAAFKASMHHLSRLHVDPPSKLHLDPQEEDAPEAMERWLPFDLDALLEPYRRPTDGDAG